MRLPLDKLHLPVAVTDSDSEILPELAQAQAQASLSLFLDCVNPLSRETHPALPTLAQERRADQARQGADTDTVTERCSECSESMTSVRPDVPCCRAAGQTEGGAVGPPVRRQAEHPQPGQAGGQGQGTGSQGSRHQGAGEDRQRHR